MHFPVWQDILQLLSRDLHIGDVVATLQGWRSLATIHQRPWCSPAVVLQTAACRLHSPRLGEGRAAMREGGREGGREGERAPAAAFPQNLVSADKNFMESWQSGGVAGWLSRGQRGPITTASVWLSLYLKKNVPSWCIRLQSACCSAVDCLEQREVTRVKMQKYLPAGRTTTMHASIASQP